MIFMVVYVYMLESELEFIPYPDIRIISTSGQTH